MLQYRIRFFVIAHRLLNRITGPYTSVLCDCYALHQYGPILCIQLTTDVFVELPDDGPVRNEKCSNVKKSLYLTN
jgi:hypothetical protein